MLHTMPDERSSPEAREAPIDEAVLDRVADRTGVDASTIADELVVLNARLIGRHAELEREYEYVTADSTRAYRVPDAVWDDFTDGTGADEALAGAAQIAHTEQAQLMFADATGVDDRFGDGEYGVVVGIDTAEEF
jgi:hypothetical protein